MVEQTTSQQNALSLWAGPSEVGNHVLIENNMRASQLIGRQLSHIGDELQRVWDDKRQDQQPHVLNVRANPAALRGTVTRMIFGNLWRAKIMRADMRSWLLPHLSSELQLRVRKWSAWVSNSHFGDWSCWTTGVLASVILLATVAVFTALWNEMKG